MRTIENTRQLREEIERLKLEVQLREERIKVHLKEVREDYRPENIIVRSISNATGIPFSKSDFLKKGLMTTLSIIVHRFLTKQESELEKKVVGWIGEWVEKIREMVKK